MDDERAHRERLRKEYTRRLRALELRIARQGGNVDPSVLSDTEDLRANIAGLDMADAPSPAPEVKDAIRRRFADDLDFWIAQLRSITDRQTRSEERTAALEQSFNDDRRERTGRQEMVDRRFDRIEQHARIRLIVQVAGAVLGLIALMVLSYVYR